MGIFVPSTNQTITFYDGPLFFVVIFMLLFGAALHTCYGPVRG